MPHKRKGSPYWWVKITPPGGRPIRRSTGTVDYKEAQALEGQWRAELYRQHTWGEKPTHTFAEVASEYLVASQGARSLDDIKRRVARVYDHFGAEFVMEEMTAQDVRGFIRARQEEGMMPATINRELSVLSAMITHAVTQLEWPMGNPVQGRKLKEPEGRVRWIRRDEAERLVEQARKQRSGDRLADFILLALNTGARMNEMLKLTWDRVDFDHALMHLEGEDNKSARRRTIPLNLVAMSALRGRRHFVDQHCPHSPWVFAKASGERLVTIREGFKSACAAVGIRDFRIHDLRHTCASWLVSAGVPLADVKEVLGHSTIKMTEKYAHLAPHRARDAVNRLGAQSRHSDNPVRRLEGLTGRKKRA